MLHLSNSDNLKTTTDTNLHSFCAKCQQYLIVDLQLICNLSLSSTSIKGMSKNNRKSIFFNVSGFFFIGKYLSVCLSEAVADASVQWWIETARWEIAIYSQTSSLPVCTQMCILGLCISSFVHNTRRRKRIMHMLTSACNIPGLSRLNWEKFTLTHFIDSLTPGAHMHDSILSRLRIGVRASFFKKLFYSSLGREIILGECNHSPIL